MSGVPSPQHERSSNWPGALYLGQRPALCLSIVGCVPMQWGGEA